MMRAVFTFVSSLAFAIMTGAAIVAVMPWLTGRTSTAGLPNAGGLHFESLVLGVVLGLFVGTLGRYHWADIPRRAVTWILIRERQFFYYTLIAAGLGVLLFY